VRVDFFIGNPTIGYASYLSYVQVEAAYNNPVMNVFVNLMMAEIEWKSYRKSFQSSCKFILYPSMWYPIVAAHLSIINSSASNNRHYGCTKANKLFEVNDMARRRWHLAYTLLRNPQLIELRRGPTSEYFQTSARDSNVNSKNVDLKLTSRISLTEDYQV